MESVKAAAPPPNPSLKKSYRCVQSLQQFYSGGPFAAASSGAFLACACGEQIKIVDASSAEVCASLEGDSESVTALSLSLDDRFLFSASHSRLIRVWDLSSFKCIRSWKGHDGPVMGMACHASGGLLATAGADKRVCVWDVDGGFCTHFFRGHQGVVTTITFHPDPNRLLLFSGSDDASVRVWNLESKKCIAVLEKHFSPVTSLAISEDGYTLLSSGRDKVVNIWDLHKYNFKMTVPAYEMVESVCIIRPGTCFSASFSLSGLSNAKKKNNGSPVVYFLTVGERGVVRIWSTESAVCIYEQQSSDATVSSNDDDTGRGFTSAVILPSDQGVLCVTADQQFLFYSATKSSEGAFKLDLCRRLVGNNEDILDMKFLGEDERYLAVATNLEQVRVYDIETMSCSYILAGHTGIVLSLDTCISSSGRTLVVTGSKDHNARLWEIESRSCIGVGKGHTGSVGAVAFSRKFRNFFVSGGCDKRIIFWSFDVPEDVGQEPTLKAKAFVSAHDKDINSLAVAPNDSLICSGSEDRTACIWRLPELSSVTVLKGHKRGIWSVEFSPVESCVLTSSGDKTIKIWSISDGSCIKTFEGHTSAVIRASFLTRGTQFVSCGGDGLVKLWTVSTNECIATYDQHESKIWGLAVGKKTEMLATGGSDSVMNLWHDSTAADKLEAFLKEEEAILRGQELENALSDADYTKAIQLAFELRRPHKLFVLFSQLCRRKNAEDPVEKALTALGKDEIRVLLEYVREWNTKPKLCHVAQFVLFRIFMIFPPSEIIEIKGVGELLEGLIPYSQRHFSRIDRLVRSTFLLDYTLLGMSVIDPEVEVRTLGSNHQFKDQCTLLETSGQGDKTEDGGEARMVIHAEMDNDQFKEQSAPLETLRQGDVQAEVLGEGPLDKPLPSKKRKGGKTRRAARKKVKSTVVDGSVISVGA